MVWGAVMVSTDALKAGVKVDISDGLPGVVVAGRPDTSGQESRKRAKAALKYGLSHPHVQAW